MRSSTESHAASRPRGGWAWLSVALLSALPAAWVFFFAHDLNAGFAWQPELARAEPARAWTAAWVHFSRQHVLVNLAGAALVAAFGIAASMPGRAALAWLLAWPLTQLGLLVMPALARYGGLSGVLHAGVAVIAIELVARKAMRDRLLGVATLAVLAAKLLSETPWRGPLTHPPGWDIAVAPIAHATGTLAGAAMALLVMALWPQPRMRRTSEVVE